MKVIEEDRLNLRKSMKKLKSDKQRRFILEYLACSDRHEAYKKVYRTDGKSISGGLSRLMKSPAVKECMDLIDQADINRYTLTKEKVLQRLAELLLADRRKFSHPDGSAKSLDQLDDVTAALVNGFKARHHYDDEGNLIGIDYEYKLAGIEKIVEMCMKHKGLFAPDQHEHTHKFDFSQLHGAVEEEEADPIAERLDAEYKRIDSDDQN